MTFFFFLFCIEKLVFICFSFDFVLSENNLKNNLNTAFRKMENAHTWKRKYKSRFELPENSVPRVHKVQYRNTLRQRVVSSLKHVPPTRHIPD